MFSGIHGFIALQNLPGIFLNMGYGSTCCADCHHKAKRQAGKADDGANQSMLLPEQYRDDYQDIEANA